ncbi:MAG: UDP-N-acetylmuramate dehydrogenase [Bacilli bacterium]|nr:UDP-N-acetylmuramate dehydrogenase [Bacilli bacterium]
MINKFSSLKENFNLKNYNTYRIDSICKYFILINDITILKELIKYLKDNKLKYFVIGNGSNIILPSYYNGVVIKLDLKKVKYNGNIVEAESSCMLNKLANETALKSLKGLEWASGIPGTIGGATIINAGCYGNELFDSIIKIEILKDNKFMTLGKNDIKYSYRYTALKNNNIIVLKVYFQLEKTNKEELLSLIRERTEKRLSTQPLNYSSAGSVFRNPVDDSAGRLIEEAGLKGKIIGGAKISDIHANFIINYNNATNEDIIKLINLIKKTIYQKYQIKLILEQEIIL